MLVVGVLMLSAACQPGTPSQYIQPGDMEDILVDYYLAKAMAQQDRGTSDNREYSMAVYMKAVLK